MVGYALVFSSSIITFWLVYSIAQLQFAHLHVEFKADLINFSAVPFVVTEPAAKASNRTQPPICEYRNHIIKNTVIFQ